MPLSPLQRRLLPIYIGKFFRNLVFWYSIEKLFMTTIGFNDISIGMMVAVYSFMSVLLEIPSGILADRWSRKKVLVLAAIALGASAWFGYAAYSIPIFLLSAIFWGFFEALASGTDTSQLYDTLLEEQGHAKNFQKYLGRYEALGGVALIMSALVGGFIGQQLSLRDAFLLSIIPSTVAIIATLISRETSIHKSEQPERIIQHTVGTFRVIFKNPNITWVIICFIAVTQANNLIGEMYQLWYLQIGVAPALYGIAGAAILSTYGIGGMITEFFTTKRRMFAALFIMLAASITVCLARDFAIIVLAQFIIGFIAFTLGLILTTQINHELPSKYRAGAGSIINSVARICYIPLALLFGWLSHTVSVYVATVLLVLLTSVGIYAEWRSRFRYVQPIQITDEPN